MVLDQEPDQDNNPDEERGDDEERVNDEERVDDEDRIDDEERVDDEERGNDEERADDEERGNNEDGADDEEDDDEDDHVKVTIDDDVPDYNLRAKQRQPQQAKPVAAIDLDAQQPIQDVDINTIEDKPWRKPGADISDYFNYGFDEETWKLYCDKQKKMKSIVNEVSCSTSETTFKIPVVSLSPARMIPTIVSNEPRYNAWIPPKIGSSAEPDHKESNLNSDHRLLGDIDGGVLRGNMDIRDRDLGRPGHMRSNDSHSLERMRDRDRKHDRDRDRERDMMIDRSERSERSHREPEPRADLRHRIDRLKEEREHVETHRSHSGSRSGRHHEHSSKHRSSSHRSEKSAKSSSNTDHTSHRSDPTSKKRDRSKDRGEREKRRKRNHE